MRLQMSLFCDIELSLGVGNDLLFLKHEFFRNAVLCWNKSVVCCCAPQSALLGSISTLGIKRMAEVVPYFVEALLGGYVFAFSLEISTIDYGVNWLVERLQIATSWHATDSFEAQGIPDSS